jgi:diadenosine tetraphosphate (Ap4A) HIT family hydrolase
VSHPTDSEAGFKLDFRLAADCHLVTDLALSRVLLMNDRRYQWLILVPRRDDMREIHHLSSLDQASLYEEITRVSELLEAEFNPTKMNIGALGNIVSQLHIHVIARNEGDPAWPGPVWGHSSAVAYASDDIEKLIEKLILKLD